MRALITMFYSLILVSLLYNTAQSQDSLLQRPLILLDQIKIVSSGENLFVKTQKSVSGAAKITINREEEFLEFLDGTSQLSLETDRKGGLFFITTEQQMSLFHISQNDNGGYRVQPIPLWYSIIPPLVAILLALLIKEVVVSLFAGIWIGSFIAGGLRWNSLTYYFESFFRSIEHYIINALADTGHLSVIVFSLLIGGMVAVISKNGGMSGVVLKLSKYAKTERSTQFVTWFMGVAIFFDDYANTLIVGNTMRSVTDSFKISREKLAYIVDSTAAPVAAIAFITTWIGAELGYIDSGLAIVDDWDQNITPYAVFLQSLKYSFYPILTLGFILMLIYQKREFGPMWKAEYRARTSGQVSPAATESEDEPDMEDLSPVPGAPSKFGDALFPILTVILVTILGLLSTGFSSTYKEIILNSELSMSSSWSDVWQNMNVLWIEDPTLMMKLGKIIGSADSYVALLWASLSGVLVAIIISVSRKTMTLFNSIHWMTTGFKTMMPAVIILTLAWSLAITTEELNTAHFLASLVEGSLNPYLIPPIIFILSALIAFSTGSSWSTMAILFPIAIPTTVVVTQSAGLEEGIAFQILLNVIANVLAASVLGDHCSPISDTTILSSLASDCNHIDHVRTQMPYALTVGSFAIVCVTLSTLLGGTWMVSLLLIALSFVLLWLLIRYVGKPFPKTE